MLPVAARADLPDELLPDVHPGQPLEHGRARHHGLVHRDGLARQDGRGLRLRDEYWRWEALERWARQPGAQREHDIRSPTA